MSPLDTDYLVVGSGAAGLAFADSLIQHTDAHVTIVDRHGKPGGHWNDAYAFVTLHQPSAFYGVDGLELGSGRKDTIGPNRGLSELASGAEVCGYFERVMSTRLLPSGRVAYHPLSNHFGEGRFESLLSGTVTQARVRRRIVDATLYSPAVPSTHTPRFEIGPGVRVVPPNALPDLGRAASRPRRFVVLGAGKTAMDACMWLMQSGADPDSIRWIVPRDAWLLNREKTQNTPEFFGAAIGSQADSMEALATAADAQALFLQLEACGTVLRIDRERLPSMFHFATVAPGEVEWLRRIRDVVRLGRVLSIDAARMQLEHGMLDVEPGSLFIDATASVVEPRAVEPVFQDGRIVLQILRMPQPAFSAALIARLEALPLDDAARNRMSTPVPFPRSLEDYPLTMLANLANQHAWAQHPALREWIRGTRLDGFGKLLASANREDPVQAALMTRLKAQAAAAAASAPRWLGRPSR